jgi:hypothetical protein
VACSPLTVLRHVRPILGLLRIRRYQQDTP